MRSNKTKWPKRLAVILAGGDGTRLKSLTRTISGDERPKQFCPILPGQTLLEKTEERVALRISPENIFYSLTHQHERFYRPLLAKVRRDALIIQSENKGTAPAILYSLLRLAKNNPTATVAFFPSDHYFSDDNGIYGSGRNHFSSGRVNPEQARFARDRTRQSRNFLRRDRADFQPFFFKSCLAS